MTPAKKTWMGIGAFLPIVGSIALMVCYVSFMMHLMEGSMMHPPQAGQVSFPPEFFGIFKLMIGVGIPLGLVSLTVMVLYIIHAVNNRAVTDGERIMWIILFVLAGAIAFPIYFFMRIAGRRNDGRVISDGELTPGNY